MSSLSSCNTAEFYLQIVDCKVRPHYVLSYLLWSIIESIFNDDWKNYMEGSSQCGAVGAPAITMANWSGHTNGTLTFQQIASIPKLKGKEEAMQKSFEDSLFNIEGSG